MSCTTPIPLCFLGGDDETIEFLWTDENDAPIDITGATANMQLRLTTYGAIAIDRAAVVTGAEGKLTFSFTDAETQALLPDSDGELGYLYDVEITLASGDTKTLFGGTITVTESVTRAAAILATDNPDLVAMYTMDNISGSTLVDESPNGNDGTITGATFAAGKFDNAIVFTGGSDDVSFSNIANVGAGDSLSTSFWIKATAGSNPSDGIVVGKFSGNIGWKVKYNLDGRIQPTCQDGVGSASVSSSSPIPDGTWKHLVCVFDRADKIRLYLDGVLDGSSLTALGTLGTFGDAAGNMQLGNKGPAWTDGVPLVGNLDQVRVFDRALTQDEIDTLFAET